MLLPLEIESVGRTPGWVVSTLCAVCSVAAGIIAVLGQRCTQDLAATFSLRVAPCRARLQASALSAREAGWHHQRQRAVNGVADTPGKVAIWLIKARC